MKNQKIILVPSMYDAREYWYNQLQQSIGIILSNKRLYLSTSEKNIQKDIFKETTFRDIISKIDQKKLLDVYSSLEKIFNECEKYVKTWESYQVLWKIQPQVIYDKLGEDIEKWKQLMSEIKLGRKNFDKGDNKKAFGSIIIDYSSIQTIVNNKYDIWHKEIMNQFALQTNEGMKQLSYNINEARSILKKNSLKDTSSYVIAFITEISKVKRNLDDKWQIDMNKYKTSHKFLIKQKYKFPNDFLKIDKVNKELNNFKIFLIQKYDAINDQEIKTKIYAEERSINKRIEKLKKYWYKKKPNKANNPLKALDILNKAEKQIEEIKDTYVKNCKAKELLGMKFSDSNTLDNIYEEIKDLEDVWSELNKIYSKIDEQKKTPFAAVNVDKIKKDLDEALTKINELSDKYFSYDIFEITQNKLTNLKKINYLIGDLRTDVIKERHWTVILKSLKIQKPLKHLLLNDFWTTDLLRKEKELQDIINQAVQELVLESYIKKSKETWINYELDLVKYKDKCKLI